MGSILPRAQHPIHALAGRVVAPNDFIRFRGEIKLPTGEVQAVRGMQRVQVDWRQRLAGNQVNHGNSIETAVYSTVVRNVRTLAVIRGDDFMWIGTGGNPSQNLQCRRIDNCYRVVALSQDQQC